MSIFFILFLSKIEIRSENERFRPDNSEVKRLYGSNEKIISLTKWQPKYVGFDGFRKGLEITIDWFNDPDNLKLYGANYEI